MKDIKGLVMFFGFTAALCLVLFGYSGRFSHGHWIAYYLVMLAGVALFFVLSRFSN